MHEMKPTLGRPKGTGHDGVSLSFRLWPRHVEAVEQLAARLQISRSAALRQIIDSIGWQSTAGEQDDGKGGEGSEDGGEGSVGGGGLPTTGPSS